MSTSPTNTQMDTSSAREIVSDAPNDSKSNSASCDGPETLRKITITLENKKITMVRKANGDWETKQGQNLSTTRQPKLNAAARRLQKRRKLYAEMTRRKKRFESTAFGRLRRQHKRELTRTAFRRMDLKPIHMTYKRRKIDANGGEKSSKRTA